MTRKLQKAVHKMDNGHMNETRNRKETFLFILLKIALTAAATFITFYGGILFVLCFITEVAHWKILYIGAVLLPSLLFPMIWLKKRKRYLKLWLIPAVIFFMIFGIDFGIKKYDESITVDTTGSVDYYEYLPFVEASKIVRLENASLKLADNLPRLDGAEALFPLYAAFADAVYPKTEEPFGEAFSFNGDWGYFNIAERESDIFFTLRYPTDDEQRRADSYKTTFDYTPIGREALVFFVDRDNPIDSLSLDQIRAIYSGEITNWKEVGGKDKAIEAFQSIGESQLAMELFMGNTPLMDAPTEVVMYLEDGETEEVSKYRNRIGSIGFSLRYTVKDNPDIKLLAIDGIAPTAENIKDGSYPHVIPILAVTYEENNNENVDKLLAWILSDEGQHIIEESGYAGVAP